MDVRKIETLKKNNQVYGSRIRVKIVKNKVAAPFKEAEIVITAQGIDKEEGLIDAAIASGVLTKSGAFLKLDNKIVGQGKEQVKILLSGDQKMKQHLTKEVMERVTGKK
ncbi:hypothetical protein A3F58_04110 [Candidatus Roizmanbacteria bacterium RIFCSPHIGHO2_12_FULL_37_9b]|nr:MAG: hypothetical protein A3F58_04110 [Candidatus Roizmanbacteria bacterium RIFCSPHIGHO2_12_FULL_37_9b]